MKGGAPLRLAEDLSHTERTGDIRPQIRAITKLNRIQYVQQLNVHVKAFQRLLPQPSLEELGSRALTALAA